MKNNLYNIESYGADYSVEHVVMMYNRSDLVIPKFQRQYVWNQKQASRFIESCILGLPIPSFFFFKRDEETKYLVVDGQQRITTLVNFKRGYFKSRENIFRLLGVNDELEGRTYEELSPDHRRRFDYAILRITIFKQTEPSEGMESVYEVFSRLNTGGLKLTSHEVRNAVIRGKINDYIRDWNNDENWRLLYGKKSPDIHMKDEELIVRFFALWDGRAQYSPPMGEFLNVFMDKNKNASDEWFDKRKQLFENVTRAILEILGSRAFRLKGAINSGVCDSVMVSFADFLNDQEISKSQYTKIQKGYHELIKNQDYIESVETGTSQQKKVQLRLKLAKEYLFER